MSAGKADSHEKYLPARPSSRGIPAIPAAGLFSHVLFPASEAAVAARPSRGCSTTVPTGTPARVYEAAWVKVRGTKVGEVREKHLRRRLARPSAETPEPDQEIGLNGKQVGTFGSEAAAGRRFEGARSLLQVDPIPS